MQIVESFPTDAHDLPVAIIATVDGIIRVKNPPPAPAGIDWDCLPPEALDQMPVLRELPGCPSH
ncbi:MAG: hypothetical protein ACE5HU_10610 [Acidobacteriota bacterium]